jgi:hypothetical protein
MSGKQSPLSDELQIHVMPEKNSPKHEISVSNKWNNYHTPPATLSLNARIFGICVKFRNEDRGCTASLGAISSKLGSSSASSTSPARKKTEKSSCMGR